MSYDYQLNRADGYMEEHGYVHVGYKTVVQFGNTLMPWKPLEMLGDPRMLYHLMHEGERRGRYMSVLTLILEALQHRHPISRHQGPPSHQLITSFPPRQLIEDIGPGFHVAATERQAKGREDGFGAATPIPATIQMRRVMKGGRRNDFHYDPNAHLSAPTIEVVESCELPYPLVMVRCLVPEHAMRHDGRCVRCKAIVVIPPGEKESTGDIVQCDAWNKSNDPEPDKSALPEEVAGG